MLFSCGLLSDSRRTEEYAWGNVFLRPWQSNSLSKHGSVVAVAAIAVAGRVLASITSFSLSDQ